ncbi:MAG: FHA domain-containing protein [Chloroflexota bacterium]
MALLALRLLAAGALYAFFAWALWLLWRDLRRQVDDLQQPALPRLTLSRSDLLPAVSYPVTALEATLGRDPTCQVYVDDSTISARHARLAYHHAQWWLEDLRSRNGTLLNGRPVDEPVVLAAGDELTCGSLTFQVLIEEAR